MISGFMQQVGTQRAYLATDFIDYAATDLSASDWTRRAAANATNMTATVEPNAVTLSGKRVVTTHTGSAQVYTETWNRVPNSTTNVETLALVTWGAASANGGSGVIARADATGANAYNSVQHGTSSTLVGCYETAEIISGADTFLAQSTTVPVAGTRYWQRFRINGTLVQGKIWSYDSIEPTAWSCFANDATNMAGYVGLMVVDASPSWFCEFFSVAIGGATAPAQVG